MKYRSMENRFCMSLVAFAVIVRLLLATGVSAALDSAVGLAPKLEAPDEPDVFLLEILEPEAAQPEPPCAAGDRRCIGSARRAGDGGGASRPRRLCFLRTRRTRSASSAPCSYQPDKQALLTRPSALSLSDDGRQS